MILLGLNGLEQLCLIYIKLFLWFGGIFYQGKVNVNESSEGTCHLAGLDYSFKTSLS